MSGTLRDQRVKIGWLTCAMPNQRDCVVSELRNLREGQISLFEGLRGGFL